MANIHHRMPENLTYSAKQNLHHKEWTRTNSLGNSKPGYVSRYEFYDDASRF